MPIPRLSPWRTASPVLAAVAALTFSVPALAQQETAASRGARVYGNMCGRCHNPRSPLERTDAQWITIANHMRVRGNLTGPEVRAVLAFLQSTNAGPEQATIDLANPAERPQPAPEVSNDPPRTDAQSVARGRSLIEAKTCVGCHVIASTGGAVGPGLDGVVQRRGARFVRAKLTNPSFNTAFSMMPNFGLSADEIEAILAYLASLNDGSGGGPN